jgi:hypothetical protein
MTQWPPTCCFGENDNPLHVLDIEGTNDLTIEKDSHKSRTAKQAIRTQAVLAIGNDLTTLLKLEKMAFRIQLIFVMVALILHASGATQTELHQFENHHHSRRLLQTFDPSFPFIIVLSLAFLGLLSCLFQFRHILFSMQQSFKVAKTPFSSDFALYQSNV